jgi:hypothetical protein
LSVGYRPELEPDEDRELEPKFPDPKGDEPPKALPVDIAVEPMDPARSVGYALEEISVLA